MPLLPRGWGSENEMSSLTDAIIIGALSFLIVQTADKEAGSNRIISVSVGVGLMVFAAGEAAAWNAKRKRGAHD